MKGLHVFQIMVLLMFVGMLFGPLIRAVNPRVGNVVIFLGLVSSVGVLALFIYMIGPGDSRTIMNATVL